MLFILIQKCQLLVLQPAVLQKSQLLVLLTVSGLQRKNRNEDIRHQFAEFNEHFIGYNENFNVKYRTFQDYLPKIVASFKNLQKRRSGDKTTVLNVFSKDEWNKLASEKKQIINYLTVADV